MTAATQVSWPEAAVLIVLIVMGGLVLIAMAGNR